MTLDDLGDEWQKYIFKRGRVSFIVDGDFDKDGNKDYVVAGKDDSISTAFIAIFNVEGERAILRYFRYFPGESRLSLQVRRNCIKGTEVIVAAFTLASDHGLYLGWDGKRYTTIDTCDPPNNR